MFDKQTPKTELMIVCDDKSMKYAKYLVQLVGKKMTVKIQPLAQKMVLFLRRFTPKSNIRIR